MFAQINKINDQCSPNGEYKTHKMSIKPLFRPSQGSKVLGSFREFPGQLGEVSRPSLEPGVAGTVLFSPGASWPEKHMDPPGNSP